MKPWTERQLNQMLQEVIREAVSSGIPVSKQISPSLDINKRTKARFGGCKKVKGLLHSTYQIELSNVLLNAEEQSIKEILAHEVLHTCPSSMNHGATWKSHCKRMEDAYGYRLSRTSSYGNLGIDDPRGEKRYRYLVECKDCGQKIFRQRKSRLTDATTRYRCKCGGKLVCSQLIEGE